MKIKIAHLYYDLMNLYGENGNVRALKKEFERQGIKTEVYFLTVEDKINFNDYDIFYMGMGSEHSQIIVLNDLLKRKENIIDAVNEGKYFFLTGNSYELFGKYIIDFDNNKIECLDIFPYYTKIINFEGLENASRFRIVGEIVGNSKLIDKKIIGFQNRIGTIYDNDSPFLILSNGTGNKPKDSNEGYVYKNFYATYTIGPLFIRNPYLTKYFIKKIIKEKNDEYKLKIYNNTSEIKAYNHYLENFNIN